MKTKIISTLLFLMLTLASTPIFAFDPPPPPPNGGNGDTPPPGGGAPVDGGVFIFVGLAAGYGLLKSRMKPQEKEP